MKPAFQQQVIRLAKDRFQLTAGSVHGVAHWSRVWLNARLICEAEQIDPRVPFLFSFLHDTCRIHDGADFQHGPDAAAFVDQLFAERHLDISPFELLQLSKAIELHSDGFTEADPVIQVCWDADRLDLGRVGILPNPKYLCTATAKRPEVIKAALARSVATDDYLQQLFAEELQ